MKKGILIFGFLLVLAACYKEVPDEQPDPFAGQDNTNNNTNKDSLDPTSFAGLHKQIFSVRCAVPLCHDGSFEPDFRSIESAYQNLVYHPVVKNDAQNSFTYRVLPYDVDKSWLIERLTTDDPVLGRMPLYADPLSETQLNNIKAWINGGCKDVAGNVAVYPNLQPQVINRFALDSLNKRLDTLFDGRFPAPFIVPPGINFTLGVQVKDDSTVTNKLKNLQFKFSYDKDDFSGATVKPAIYLIQDYIIVSLNSSQFQPNKTVYFRFYCQDEHHSSSAEFPQNASPFYYKDLFAFIVK
ncbi:MAG TPA: hypothetical protein DIW47_08035 [Bacteroidetes bacterium]|nr:hypothetical protein [Bacteroidota bacterium]